MKTLLTYLIMFLGSYTLTYGIVTILQKLPQIGVEITAGIVGVLMCWAAANAERK